MSLIDLPTARAHLRVEPDYPDAQVVLYLNAAERLASEFLNRGIYADGAALTAAVVAAPTALTAASAAYDAAREAAAAIEDAATQEAALAYAEMAFAAAKTATREAYDGVVVNDTIKAGILLTMTSLHENRGDDGAVPGLPRAAVDLLFPFRVGLGV